MDIPQGTRLRNKKSGNIFITIGKPYLYETKYPAESWWKVGARSLKDNKIHHIRLDNFLIIDMKKFILYGCADCLDDDGNVILFAFPSGDNIQNGVFTPISCPLCNSESSIVALKEVEIDTESGLGKKA